MKVQVIWNTNDEEIFECDKVTCDGAMYILKTEGKEDIIFAVGATKSVKW